MAIFSLITLIEDRLLRLIVREVLQFLLRLLLGSLLEYCHHCSQAPGGATKMKKKQRGCWNGIVPASLFLLPLSKQIH